MTYATKRLEQGHEYTEIARIVADQCSRNYGETATNLLTYSEQFDNAAWTKTGSSITADSAYSPSETYVADKLVEDTSTGNHLVSNSATVVSGTTYTGSVYVRAAERTKVVLYETGDASTGDTFNLTTGKAETSNYSPSIKDLGNGWFRCSITWTQSDAGAVFEVRLHNGTSTSYTGDGASGVYLWGAQLVAGIEPGHYVVTTTASATGECTAGRLVTGTVVRSMADRVYLDSSATATSDLYNSDAVNIYTGTGAAQTRIVSDYVAESVTNSILYSRDVSNVVWARIGTPTYTQDQTGIFGEANIAWTVTDDAVGSSEGFRQDVTITADTETHIACVAILKDADETRFPALQLATVGGTTQRASVQLNTKTGAIVEANPAGTTTRTYDVIDAGGWWILIASVQNDGSNTTARVNLYPASGDVFGTVDVAAVGSCVIDMFQLRLNASSIGELVPTTSAPVTETVRVAHVRSDFATIPDNTSGYRLIDYPNACYKTRNTCQDTTNYTKTKTTAATFSKIQPLGVRMFPALEKITRQHGTVTGGLGLGDRATVTVRVSDFKDNDALVDPYYLTRSYDTTQGTFWGKWIARNQYWEGRTLEVYRGYVSSPFSWDDFQKESYDLTGLKGPAKGTVTITGKDALTRTYGKKVVYPAQSEGYLSAGITSGATSATLAPTGIGDTDYPASGYISIGDEAISFTRSGDTLTLTRAQWGTTAISHDANDTVQICASWDTVNVLDALEEVLLASGFGSQNIPNGTGENWDDERSLWMKSSTIKGILLKPEPVDKLISEWSQLFMFDVWWDLIDEKVYAKALAPEASGVTIQQLGDNYDLVDSSLDRMPDKRITTAIVSYNKSDFSEDQRPENFKETRIGADLASISDDLYGKNSIKRYISRWFDSSGRAAQLESRVRARFGDTPEKITFEITSKDEDKISLAGRIQLNTDVKQDVTGANVASNYQITKIIPNEDGSIVEAVTSSFTGRYAFIGPAGLPDYSSATDDQKSRYAFICPASGVFSDGGECYKII